MYHKQQLSPVKTYNQLDIEQLGVCTMKLRHEDRNATCRFFVVPEDGQPLLGMPDIELLNILKRTFEVKDDTHESRKFNSQKREASNNLSCRANRTLQNKTDKVDANDINANMPYFVRSSINRAADKRASEVMKTKYIINSLIFSGLGCFEGSFSLQVKDGS